MIAWKASPASPAVAFVAAVVVMPVEEKAVVLETVDVGLAAVVAVPGRPVETDDDDAVAAGAGLASA